MFGYRSIRRAALAFAAAYALIPALTLALNFGEERAETVGAPTQAPAQAALQIDPCAELKRVAPSMAFTTESMGEFESMMMRAQEDFETLDRNLADLTKKKQAGNDFNAIFGAIMEKYSSEVDELEREAQTGKYGPCRGPQSCMNSAMAGLAARHPDLFRKDFPKACVTTVENAYASYGLPSPSSGLQAFVNAAATWALAVIGCVGAGAGIWAYALRRKGKPAA